MSRRDLYNWIVGGFYVNGDHKAVVMTRGYCLNLDSRRGRLTYWLLNLDEAIRRGPWDMRRWSADQLGRAAIRLRGGKTYVFGYYDCSRGNRAAMLIDRLRDRLLMKLDHDDFMETEDTLNELAQVKGALEVRNDAPPDAQLPLLPDVIPAQIVQKAHEVAQFMEQAGYGRGWCLGPVKDRREDPL